MQASVAQGHTRAGGTRPKLLLKIIFPANRGSWLEWADVPWPPRTNVWQTAPAPRQLRLTSRLTFCTFGRSVQIRRRVGSQVRTALPARRHPHPPRRSESDRRSRAWSAPSVPAPNFFRLTLHRRRDWVLEVEAVAVRPERYREPSRFDTMPSMPSLQTCRPERNQVPCW